MHPLCNIPTSAVPDAAFRSGLIHGDINLYPYHEFNNFELSEDEHESMMVVYQCRYTIEIGTLHAILFPLLQLGFIHQRCSETPQIVII